MGPPKRVTIVDVNAGHKVIGEIPFANSVRPPALAADNKRFFQHVDGLVGFQVADIASRKVIATVKHNIPEKYKGKSSRCHGLGSGLIRKKYGPATWSTTRFTCTILHRKGSLK